MALYDPVNGVYRKVSKKYDPVNGVYRNVVAAYDPVDGVYRKYFGGGGNAGSLKVGDSIWINVKNTPTEFLVVHQGNPDSAIYDASCDGTWLLAKNVWASKTWDEDDEQALPMRPADNYYGDSIMHSYWLDYEFRNSIDSNVKNQIKQVKIPYWTGTGISGLSTKTFLLSGYEVGWTTGNSDYFPVDGACLDYFKGTAQTDAKRIAYYTGSAKAWWLRSPYKNNETSVFCVATNGTWTTYKCHNSYGVRPAFIMDSSTPITQANGKNIIE